MTSDSTDSLIHYKINTRLIRFRSDRAGVHFRTAALLLQLSTHFFTHISISISYFCF
eukprot:SAG31_NODE_1785_length_7278_cov_4.205321_2_plen_57_part_00